jgi:hypothetical protein
MSVVKTISLAVLAVVWVTGCTTTSGTSPEPIASQEPRLSFFSEGSAAQNLPIFKNVLETTAAGKQGHDLAETLALLVETGFKLENITHTPVDSKIGEPAESVSLAVAFNGECLIAQFSNSWITTTIAKPTVSGCLIGDFRQASLDKN